MGITDERYVSLTSFRADGTPRPTPVWIAAGAEPGTAVFTTDLDSYKVKRIRNDARVTLHGCDARGNVRDGAPVVSGTAVVVEGGPVADDVATRIGDKYGIQKTLIDAAQQVAALFRRGAPTSTGAVVITLDATSV